MKLPKARTENLLEQNLPNETLIYDLNIDKAFNLNETSTIVYKSCGQKLTFDELKRKHKFSDEFIYLALDELKRNNLLSGEYDSPFANTNRRDVIKKVGLASMMVLPIITGLAAPKAVNAASGSVAPDDPSFRIGAPCDRNFTPNCINSGGFCTETASGDRCCTDIVGSQNLFLSGQTSASDETNFRITVLPVDTPREDTTTCPSIIRCCDSREPYGATTYTFDRLLENDPQRAFFTVGFSCTCP